MTASSQPERALASKIPVLKMPADLALPSLRVLAADRPADVRRSALTALRPGVPERTLLNAYVLPSLNELGLYDGTLRSGRVTRYGAAVAKAKDAGAHVLMAHRLVDIDGQRVHLVGWLAQRHSKGEPKKTALRSFIEECVDNTTLPQALDRLGKWASYLIHFGVVRETHKAQMTIWSVNRRHIEALAKAGDNHDVRKLSDEKERDALLEAYARSCQQIGTRLYVPIEVLRDIIGTILVPEAGTLLDTEIDDIIRRAPRLLADHVVSFSPFSGPARGGLQLEGMYAGYLSIRQRVPGTRTDSGVEQD